MRLLLLGTSGAWPIPRPGCSCPQCAEARADPRRRRLRSSLLLVAPEEVVLVDPGPDVSHQFERWGGEPRVDRVLVTHTHADHCLGLDDLVHLRRGRERPLPVHAAPWHRARLQEVFPHLFEDPAPKALLEDWSPGTRRTAAGVEMVGFETGHREAWPTTGVLLRVPRSRGVLSVAYAPDMGRLPPATRDLLRGIDLLVADGSFLGPPGPGHPGTDAVQEEARSLGVSRVVFTHVGHVRLAHADLCARLGHAARVALDGDDLLAGA